MIGSISEYLIRFKIPIIPSSLFLFSSILIATGWFSVVGAIIILYVIPGFAIFSYFCKTDFDAIETLFISFIVGLSFQTILGYGLSFLNLPAIGTWLPFVLAFISIPLTRHMNFRAISGRQRNIWLVVLVAAAALLVIQIPRSDTSGKFFQEVGPFPVGDDSKLHTFLIQNIISERGIPDKLHFYPEVQRVRYPMGYHLMIAESQSIGHMNLYNLIFYSGMLLLSSLPIFLFILTRHLFDDKVGLLSAIISIGSVSLFKFVFLGMYPHLLGLLMHTIAILFLFLSLKDNRFLVLVGIALAALLMTNPYPFLVTALLALCIYVHSRDIKKAAFAISIAVIFSIPYIANLVSVPIVQTDFYYKIYPIIDIFSPLNIKETVSSITSYVNVLILVLGIISLRLLKDKVTFRIFAIWLILLGILFFKNILIYNLNIHNISLLFYILPEKVLYTAFIPLSILSAYLVNRYIRETGILIIFFAVFLSYPVLSLYNSDLADYKYASKTDIDFLDFVRNNTKENEIIFNDFYLGSTSTWIPIYAERKVTFPFLIFDPDAANEIVNVDKNYEITIVKEIPESRESLQILKANNASYVAFSSIAENKLLPVKWNAKLFEGSPCYTKLYGKDDLWLFRINYDCDYFEFLVVDSRNNILAGDEQEPAVVEFNLSGVSLGPALTRLFDTYIVINYTYTLPTYESAVAELEFEGVSYPYSLSVFNKKYLIPLPRGVLDKDRIQLSVSGSGLEIESASLVLSFRNSSRNGNLYVLGLEKSDGIYKIMQYNYNSWIILEGSKGNSRIKYIDSGDGNVDFNYWNGTWRPLGTIFRQNTNSTITKEFYINQSSRLLGIGIFTYKQPFRIVDITFNNENS